MSTQKLKKGFTLIELMVVIVIIGILAAIAIPKLFGMSAKAKASEVAPAAGTWMKLLVAYSMEKNTYGSFSRIGYIIPGGDAFTYSGNPPGNVETETADWSAKNKAKLNDCAPDSEWKITAKFGETPTVSIAGDEVPMKCVDGWQDPGDGTECPKIPADDKFEPGACSSLTPSFAKVAAVSGP